MSSAPPAAIGTTRRTGRVGAQVPGRGQRQAQRQRRRGRTADGAESWMAPGGSSRMSGQRARVNPNKEPAGPRRVENPMPNDAPPMAALIEGRLDRLGLTPEEAAARPGCRRISSTAWPRAGSRRRAARSWSGWPRRWRPASPTWSGSTPTPPPPAELLEEEQGSLGLLAGDEEALLRAYRRLEFPQKAAVVLVVRSMAGPEPVRMRCRRSGSGGAGGNPAGLRPGRPQDRRPFRRLGADEARRLGRAAGSAARPRPRHSAPDVPARRARRRRPRPAAPGSGRRAGRGLQGLPGGGRIAGRPRPRPASAASGSSRERCAVVTASARTLPSLASGASRVWLSIMRSARPATRSVTACGVPR